MQSDYHIHTYLCKHAKGEPSQYLETARSKGITEICFTDHVPAPDGYDPRHRMTIDQFDDYRKLITNAQQPGGPVVLFGIEADYYENCEEFLGSWLPSQNFDLVIGSIHYIRDWGFDNPEERTVWDSIDVTETWREYFRLVQQLARTGLFDIVGHLDLPKKFGHKPSENDIKKMAIQTLDTLAEAGMGIEINTSGTNKPIGEIYPSKQFLVLANERDIPICFGSDAHQPDHVGYAFDKALALAQSAGYTHCLRMRGRKKELIPLP